MRLKHGLDPDRTTIIVSAGGFGVGPIEHIMTSLGDMRHPAQVLAMCGRNEELLERMGEIASSKGEDGNVVIHPIGFILFMGRLVHGFGLSRSTGATWARAVGVLATWVAYVAAAAALLFYAIP